MFGRLIWNVVMYVSDSMGIWGTSPTHPHPPKLGDMPLFGCVWTTEAHSLRITCLNPVAACCCCCCFGTCCYPVCILKDMLLLSSASSRVSYSKTCCHQHLLGFHYTGVRAKQAEQSSVACDDSTVVRVVYMREDSSGGTRQ